MNLEPILNNIEQAYAPLSKACREEFIANSEVKHFEKGDIVVREGQYAKKAYLIINGCARAYYLKNGKDITDWLTFENQFMASIISFFSNEPSPHYVAFAEDSTVLEFSKDTVDALSNKHHDFERFISKIVTETMLGLCERLHIVQFSKAEERYQHLISVYPNITQRIPLTHIASYLGITLETLSRIRSKNVRI
ncbi:cAMP-binding protein [Mangrovimonas yunxiaonensis]|uniref:cAMP-binding protein n=1 Tax=Mangrovimonas yunxiaonensis TaxID=1197477 RepID=A0A084TK52_9FLAO|nr:Crp/Fnr family transcriptional regulator [Mangrovimonas yunxiaonensis]KFB01088.1 cAMP-binding protein [Mangrovimonas yunxiaonensis]MBR9757870.1 Crp/Fnr family transcriptional regulator [Algicola sp.]GGH38752.1 cyclic nucleotide-binding protein [Mangrovimonas yunxiaonensis]